MACQGLCKLFCRHVLQGGYYHGHFINRELNLPKITEELGGVLHRMDPGPI